MLERINIDKKESLNRLLQLYLHNISLYFPMDIDNDTCLYEYDDISKYFESDNNLAFFIKENERVVGFMLIDLFEDKNVVQEMFILNNYKKHGFGKKAVIELFESYKGNWEIKSLPCSKEAECFWTKVVKEYTFDKYELTHIGKYNRAVLTFSNK